MAWTLTANSGDYLDVAGDFLTSRRVRHTIELSVIESLRAAPTEPAETGEALFGWWQVGADGDVTAVVLHTPPYPLLLGGLPSGSGAELAALIAGTGRGLAGVGGPEDSAAEFATAWRALTAAEYTTTRRSRLYRLERLVPPDPLAEGRARLAIPGERAVLEEWYAAFGREINDVAGPPADAIAERLSYGGLMVWEAGGLPVSMAGHVRPAAGVVRIAPVYTPAPFRGRGYGAAVTSAVTRAALEAGAGEIVLFTDVANAASNALYRRLGFQPVEERIALSFSASSG
jgi:predicted GNAT family acetyltransferase